MTEFTLTTTIDSGFDETIDRVRGLLQEAGFGVLTEIDIASTLKNKIGVTMEPKVILGACRPELAHQMLGIDPRLAALLPCNVVVTQDGAQTTVEIVDPLAMADITGNVAAQTIAREARCRLEGVINGLKVA